MKNSVTSQYFIVIDILKYLSSFKNSYDFFTVKMYVNNIWFFSLGVEDTLYCGSIFLAY
jgi:hypothetical protein